MANSEEQPHSRDLPEGLKGALAEFLREGNSQVDSVDRARFEAVAGYIQELLAERDDSHNEIDTQSGEKIRPLNPDPTKIHLKDIAHGLSNVGRFAGQGHEFLSVARHSVHVSLEVEARGESKDAQRYALVHDAAEAYLSDVPGPVKKDLLYYKHVERRLDRAVVSALGIGGISRSMEVVKEADKIVGEYELSMQFPERDYKEPAGLHHDPEVVDVSEPDKSLYIRRARKLGLR